MEIIIKKEDLSEDKVLSIVDRVTPMLLDRRTTANVVRSYGALMANVFLRRQSGYKGIDEVCEGSISEISSDEKIKNYISFVISMIMLNEIEFDEATVIVSPDGTVEVKTNQD